MWTKPATKVRVRTSAPIHNQSNLELFSCGDWGIVALYFSIHSGNGCSAMVVLLTAVNSPLLAVGFVFALEQTAAQNLTRLGARRPQKHQDHPAISRDLHPTPPGGRESAEFSGGESGGMNEVD